MMVITFIYYNHRHSNKPQPVDRVNKYLAQALVARSVDREKRDHVNFFTLRFKESASVRFAMTETEKRVCIRKYKEMFR